jgi:hypothetical protein
MLSGSASLKAVRRTLMKLSPDGKQGKKFTQFVDLSQMPLQQKQKKV